MAWKTYRLYRLAHKVGRDMGRAVPCGPEVPTRITIRARTQKEAERKAIKLNRENDWQLEVIIVKDESPIDRFAILDL